MSAFDFDSILTKTAFDSAPVADPNDAEVKRQRRISRIQRRVTHYFAEGRPRHTLRLKTTDLSAQDKADLIAAIEGKGYTCVENGTVMTMQ